MSSTHEDRNRWSVTNSRGPLTLTKLVEQTGATPAPSTDTANPTQVVILAVPRRLVAQIDRVIPPDAERQFAQRNARRHDRGRERTAR